VALSGDRCDARGDARGDSLELSLALSPVAHSPLGLYLCDQQRTGVPTEVFTGIGEVGRGLAARKRAPGDLVRLQGPCSAPLASVPLLVTAVTSPLPRQPVGWGRGAMKRRCGSGV
jgi:hypothetical protein